MFQSMTFTSIAVASMILVSDVNANGKWEKHGKEDGIIVYTTGYPQSKVPLVKAVTVVNAPSDKVWQYITQSMEIDGLKDRRTLDTCGRGCDYVYVRMGNWMITDRYYVIKVNWSVSDKEGHPQYFRRWSKTSERKPAGTKGVPVRSIRGSWTLTPIDNGKRTRITYINHLDLGGNVPPLLFSRGFVSNAYDLLRNIRKNA
ncbi:MAG: hypothetical protein JXR76_07925 [Deltaproteobacteria bacterium]|nr:hypothetical protein [Deltaproteobacteria bacterium]